MFKQEVTKMEQKDMYTIEELYGELGITLTELSKRTGVSDVTLAKIRDGQSARRSTVNSLLHAFSEIYNIRLSTENVKGIIIRDKLARRQEQERLAENIPIPSNTTSLIDSTSQEGTAQNRPTMAKKSTSSSTSAKKSKDSGLPEGAILATDFARNHGVARETFRDHMLIGLGAGTVYGEELDPVMAVKDHVDYSERPKPGRPREKERYLTADQQRQALEFWRRHKVAFEPCDRLECWCHSLD
ncbi:MAG: hypothetical protein AUG51_16200 [Acidobacteria bacterium 13_1_20CM_3_53_8]|nr:MAG: hypothetical protein AUG51_16200 [Acidobacteria bacterium 13_1_20CM_3_53_8]